MSKAETIEQVRIVCRTRRLSRHTEETYAGWIDRFCTHIATGPQLPREDRVRVVGHRMGGLVSVAVGDRQQGGQFLIGQHSIPSWSAEWRRTYRG